ncbi:hypothetical protein ONZ51_g9320 [Trametes cubensis]|uniref:Uncharacterized protein n=1 Tax=Trametes cubensis TaxID=1111947 RepID=A0AAD7X9W8_9APHY|nr:hypothetical protein ONZ51_g9320 [Trametes cubensis]
MPLIAMYLVRKSGLKGKERMVKRELLRGVLIQCTPHDDLPRIPELFLRKQNVCAPKAGGGAARDYD